MVAERTYFHIVLYRYTSAMACMYDNPPNKEINVKHTPFCYFTSHTSTFWIGSYAYLLL